MLLITLIQTPEAKIAPITEALRQGRELSSTFFAVNPKTLFRTGVTPERLKKIFDVRSIERETLHRPGRTASFLAAFRLSHITRVLYSKGSMGAAIGIDARYGLAVEDNVGRPLLWICTDASGSWAIADSITYRLSRPASTWFQDEASRLLALKRAPKKL